VSGRWARRKREAIHHDAHLVVEQVVCNRSGGTHSTQPRFSHPHVPRCPTGSEPRRRFWVGSFLLESCVRRPSGTLHTHTHTIPFTSLPRPRRLDHTLLPVPRFRVERSHYGGALGGRALNANQAFNEQASITSRSCRSFRPSGGSAFRRWLAAETCPKPSHVRMMDVRILS
jgi:hypothetical protein